jgi:hypothetical protein
LLSLVLNPKHVCSAPLMLSDWRLGARTLDTSNQCLVHLPGYYYTELPKAYIYEWDLWLGASSGTSGPAPSGVTLIPTSFSVVELTSYHHGHKGARHRCVQLRWWPLPDLPIAPPRGPAIDVSLNLVHVTRIFLATPTRGVTAVNITATGKQLGRKMEARVSAKKIWVLAVPRTWES